MEIELMNIGCQSYELKSLNLFLLSYADDSVLLSENVDDLQKMINSVNVCSNEYGLYINLLKTKIVIFRNRGHVKAEEKWFLNDNKIDVCNEFMYLGILFYVSSMLNYGCEVWGYHKADDVEKVHICYIKRILKGRKPAVNYMVYCELGIFPMYIERYCEMLRYWFKLICTDNYILKCLYEDMLESSELKPNAKLNWACRVKRYSF